MSEKIWVLFRGTNKIRDTEVFQMHGLSLEKGKIYPVTKEVAEYLKHIVGFEICKGIGSDKIIDFPKKKKKVIKNDKKDVVV